MPVVELPDVSLCCLGHWLLLITVLPWTLVIAYKK